MTVVLRPYQEEGIALIHEKDGRALLGDDPGLGKTVQALTYLKRHVPPGHVVVLCPASVKYHWQKEARDHVGMRAEVLEGMTPPDRVPPSRPKIWVLSYNILGTAERGDTWLRFLRALKPVLVILDEAQFIKDSSTKRFQGVRKLVKGVPRVLALSGTPVENHAGEVWTTAHLLRPDVEYFSNWPRFARRFTNPVRKPWGWVFKGSRNVAELHKLLTDTCFPYHTLVQTKEGLLPIGKIVQEKLRTEVLCYDRTSASLSWRPILAHSKRNETGRMVRVLHETGEFCCTPDHPVWVEETGWTRAESLATGVHLLRLRAGENNSPGPIGNVPVLLNKVCGEGTSGQRGSRQEVGDDKMRPPAETTGSVPGMWQTNNTGQKTLLPEMRSHSAGPRNEKTNGRESKHGKENLSAVPTAVFPIHPSSLPNGRALEEKKVLFQKLCPSALLESDPCRAKDLPSQEDFGSTANSPQSLGMAEEVVGGSPELRSGNGTFPERKTAPHTLARHSQPESETGGRGGRAGALHGQAETSGQKEGTTVEKTRVVRVEVLELGNRLRPFPSGGTGPVYDIEVAEHHNFFADGVLVHNCLIRRKKEDVLKDLPACVTAIVPFKLSAKDMTQYKAAEEDIVGWLAKTHGKRTADKARKAEQVVKLGHLKRLAAKLRLDQSYQWALEQLEATEQKIVLFGVGRKLLLDLEGRFNGRAVLINGSVSPKDRPGLISRFRNDTKVTVFLGNIRAAGVGMDGLQYASSQMAFLELDWNPAALKQAIGRLDRLGQRFSTLVSIHTTIGTVDELLLDVIQKKSRTADEITDGKASGSLDIYDMLEKKLLEKK